MSVESTYLNTTDPLAIDAERAENPPVPRSFEAARGMLTRASNYLWSTRSYGFTSAEPYRNRAVLDACTILDGLACMGRYL